jgi:hypothetical protein
MLRDLGGLVYEVHRTGGGDMPAHAGLLEAKLERLVALDGEARALEATLSAPREQVILFEPGVGGTCAVCGELYGSDARFCSHCGAATSGEPEATPAEAPESERAPTLAEPAPASAEGMPEPPPEPAAPGAEAPTSVLPAAAEKRGGAAGDRPAGDRGDAPRSCGDEAGASDRGDTPPSAGEAGASDRGDTPPSAGEAGASDRGDTSASGGGTPPGEGGEGRAGGDADTGVWAPPARAGARAAADPTAGESSPAPSEPTPGERDVDAANANGPAERGNPLWAQEERR